MISMNMLECLSDYVVIFKSLLKVFLWKLKELWLQGRQNPDMYMFPIPFVIKFTNTQNTSLVFDINILGSISDFHDIMLINKVLMLSDSRMEV